MHRTIIRFVQPQPNSIQNKNNTIGCGTAPGNLVICLIHQMSNIISGFTKLQPVDNKSNLIRFILINIFVAFLI